MTDAPSPEDLLRAPRAQGRGALWVDGLDYAAGRLADGAVPWHLPAELASLLGGVHGLLRSDVTLVPLRDIVLAHLYACPELRTAVESAPSDVRRLRALLGDAGLREVTLQAVNVIVASTAPRPVVVTLPAPPGWLQLRAAHGPSPTSADSERASMFVADFLRLLGGSGISAVVLDERGLQAMATDLRAASLTPILNVGGHFRWPVFLRGHASVFLLGESRPRQVGDEVPESIWAGQDPPAPAPGRLTVITVPVDADPDHVQSVITRLTDG